MNLKNILIVNDSKEDKMKKISVIVPCYNEEDVIEDFYVTLTNVLQNKMSLKNYEIIFVNDGSRDYTIKKIQEFSLKDEHVAYLSFSRNFGKESAMYAGLQYSEGEFTVIMDSDLQHPPEIIVEMYKQMQTEQYDMIATRRANRGSDSALRAICGELFYKVMNRISGIDMGNNAMDFRMLNRKAKMAIMSMAEYNRFSKGIFEWIGFRTKWIEIEIPERKAGNSKWSFISLLKYSIDGCLAFSTLPLALSSFLGIMFCIIALLIIISMIIIAGIEGVSGNGYATIICTILIVGGVQLFCMGILGQYLAKAYMEIKNRPKFLLQDISSNKKEGNKIC